MGHPGLYTHMELTNCRDSSVRATQSQVSAKDIDKAHDTADQSGVWDKNDEAHFTNQTAEAQEAARLPKSQASSPTHHHYHLPLSSPTHQAFTNSSTLAFFLSSDTPQGLCLST